MSKVLGHVHCSLAALLAAACSSSTVPTGEANADPAGRDGHAGDGALAAEHDGPLAAGRRSNAGADAAAGAHAELDPQPPADAGPQPPADAGPPLLPDPTSADDWQVDFRADDVIDTIAVAPDGHVWIGGRLGLLAERGSDGRWQRVELGDLLAAYDEPRGEWQWFLFDGDDLWIAGALGFYHGGAVRRRAGTWSIAYDERRDTPDFVVGGPFRHIALASDGSVVLPVDGQLVQQGQDGAFRLVPPEDPAVAFGGVAAANGRIFGIGEHVFELEDAAAGRWRRRAGVAPAGTYVLSAALDGEQLYAVANPAEGEGVVLHGTLDALDSSFPYPVTLYAVELLAPGDAWIVGKDGFVLRGSNWRFRHLPGPSGDLAAIARSGSVVYIGTTDGIVYRYEARP